MNILLLGSGGREHALAWAIKKSTLCDTLFVAPGNGGTAAHNVALDAADHGAVVSFCSKNDVELVVIGPEAPLVDGLADTLRDKGITTFGPNAAAAQLEGSKAFTKAVCDEANAPTAGYAAFSNLDAALAHLNKAGAPIVVKADGLAAGKGVTVAEDIASAQAALQDIFADGDGEVVLEDMLVGEEVSLFFLCDGTTALPFGSAQDHKRAGDGDTGPNTGGMGAYSPASVATDAIWSETLEQIVQPTLDILAKRGTPFSGVLYVGLMLTGDGPKLIEYNVRFGDPECQVLMARLESDIVPYLLASARGTLGKMDAPQWSRDVALTVVMAAKGYPGSYEKNTEIQKLTEAEATGAMIFHAGTLIRANRTIAIGGRVLCVTGKGDSVSGAQGQAYAAVDAISWPEGFCRRDIGWREIAREA
jgi:phosphoribosylamine--glycine ligase